MIRRIITLTIVLLAMIFVPKMVHASSGQTILLNDVPNPVLTDQKNKEDLVKATDTILDSITNNPIGHMGKNVFPLEIKTDVLTHPLKNVDKKVNQAVNVAKVATRKPFDTATHEVFNNNLKKPIHLATKEEHTKVTPIHFSFVKRPHSIKNSSHHHQPFKKEGENKLDNAAQIMNQRNEKSDQSGGGTNNDTSGHSVFGLMDKYGLIKNIRLNKPTYLKDKRGAQWENAPPTPPPDLPLRFLSL